MPSNSSSFPALRLGPLTALLTLVAFFAAQLPTLAWAAPSTAVLGLDGSPKKRADALTASIRRAFARRGMNVSTRLSFAEYRLMMNCGEDNYRCIARSSQALNADRLLFGRLDYEDQKPALTLRWLDTNSGRLLQSRIFHLSEEQLAHKTIDVTGAAVAEALILNRPFDISLQNSESDKEEPDNAKTPSPATTEANKQAEDSTQEPEKRLDRVPEDNPNTKPPGDVQPTSTTLAFNRTSKEDKNKMPIWPAVGLGVSLPLALGAWGVAIWSRHQVSSNGPLHKKIHDAADKSLMDSDPLNDINKRRRGDLCPLARAPLDSSKRVRNPDMAKICDRGDTLRAVNTLSIVGGAVLSSAAGFFLGALIHYKRQQKSKKRPKDRKIGWRGAWQPGEGFYGGAEIRF